MPRRNQVDNSSRRTWTRRGEAFHDTDSHNLDPAQAGCSSNSSSFQQVGIGFSESADDYEERDDAQIKDIGIRLKLMYVSAMLSKAGLSQNQARLMCDDVCEVMVDKGSRIFAYDNDVKPFIESVLEKYALVSHTLCCKCSNPIGNAYSSCQNSHCTLYRSVITTRGKNCGHDLLLFVDIKPQLRELVQTHCEIFVNFSRNVHLGTANIPLADPRCSQFYVTKMETKQQFERNIIIVQFALAYDGVKMKYFSRRELWPLYLECISLPLDDRHSSLNSVVASMFCSFFKPGKEVQRLTFDRLINDIQILNSEGTYVDFEGTRWKFIFRLSTAFLDLAVRAQRLLYGVPAWNSEFGCSKCYAPGVRVASSRVWYWSSDTDITLRTRRSFAHDSHMGQHCVKPDAPALGLVFPTDITCDWLHLVQEGIMKNRIDDLLGKTHKLEELRLSKKEKLILVRILAATRNYTYANKFILTLDDRVNLSGSEIEALYMLALPLVAILFETKPIYHVLVVLGQWIICCLVSDHKYGASDEQIFHAQQIARFLSPLALLTCPSVLTMKYHLFMDHYIEKEYEFFGAPVGYTTSTSERWHREMILSSSQLNCNSLKSSKKNGKRLYPRAREQDDASQKYCQNRPEHSRSPYQRAREQDGVYEHQHDKPSVRPIHLASGPRFAKASHGFDDRFEINPKSLKVELLSSIKSGNFDTITASLILLEYHDSGKYNPAQYQEFLDDGKLIQITRFDAFSPLLPQEICRHPDSLILDKFRQMLKDDVNLVLNRHALLSVHKQNDKISKEFDLRANRDLKFSRVNLVSNTLCIPEDADFKAVDIFELLKTWPAPPENHNAYDKLFSATKYVLSQLTKKPGEIGRFTHTFSGNKPRKYTKLPDTIVNTLGDMMLQLTDTYDPILNYSVEQAPEKYPAKWSSLADDEQSRIRKFNSLKSLKGKVLDSFNKTLIEALSELRRVDFKSDHQSSNAPLKRKSSG